MERQSGVERWVPIVVYISLVVSMLVLVRDPSIISKFPPLEWLNRQLAQGFTSLAYPWLTAALLEVSQAHTGLAIIFILAAITTVMTTLTLVGRRSQAIPDHDTWWQRQWLKYEPRLQWMISVMVLVLVLAELVHPGILWRLCRQLGLV